MNIFCKIGLHWPLKIGSCAFYDHIGGKEVFNATCSCGKEFLTDDVFGLFGSVMIKEPE